jgi:hypothetical protein
VTGLMVVLNGWRGHAERGPDLAAPLYYDSTKVAQSGVSTTFVYCGSLSLTFVHLALTAFLPCSLNFFFDSFLALAGPPFKPPRRPSATAAGFFFLAMKQ